MECKCFRCETVLDRSDIEEIEMYESSHADCEIKITLCKKCFEKLMVLNRTENFCELCSVHTKNEEPICKGCEAL